MNKLKKQKKIKMDKCMKCGIDTIYSKDISIEYRNNYEPGIGQLCPDCYKNIYK